MTDIPQPYPGDLPRESTPAVLSERARLYREYRDIAGDVLIGTVHIRDSRDRGWAVELVDGNLDLELLRGRYRLVAALFDKAGHPYYSSETVIV